MIEKYTQNVFGSSKQKTEGPILTDPESYVYNDRAVTQFDASDNQSEGRSVEHIYNEDDPQQKPRRLGADGDTISNLSRNNLPNRTNERDHQPSLDPYSPRRDSLKRLTFGPLHQETSPVMRSQGDLQNSCLSLDSMHESQEPNIRSKPLHNRMNLGVQNLVERDAGINSREEIGRKDSPEFPSFADGNSLRETKEYHKSDFAPHKGDTPSISAMQSSGNISFVSPSIVPDNISPIGKPPGEYQEKPLVNKFELASSSVPKNQPIRDKYTTPDYFSPRYKDRSHSEIVEVMFETPMTNQAMGLKSQYQTNEERTKANQSLYTSPTNGFTQRRHNFPEDYNLNRVAPFGVRSDEKGVFSSPGRVTGNVNSLSSTNPSRQTNEPKDKH